MDNANQIKNEPVGSRLSENFKSVFRADAIFFITAIILKLLYFNFSIGGVRDMSPSLAAATLGSVLILTCGTLLLPSFYRTMVLFLIDGGITFVLISDLLFYRYFSDVISMPVLLHASNVGSVKSSVGDLLHLKDIIFFIDLVVGLCLVYIAVRFRKSYVAKRIWHKITAVAIMMAVGALSCYYGFSVLLQSQPAIFKSFYDRIYIVQNIGLINFHSVDAYKFFAGQNEKQVATAEEKQQIKEFILEKKKNKPEKIKLYGAGKGKNLIVIQMEALQEFVINREINGQEITPNLNKLVKKSLYFNNYYCQTAGGGTSDAEFLSQMSMYPVKEGSVYIRYSGNEYYSMAEKMKENGYKTIAMHAYKPGFWNRSVMYQSLGFDEFFNKNHLAQDEIIGMGVSDKSFFRQSLEKLKKDYSGKPYYAFMITLTSHYPFNNDKKFYSPFDVGQYKNTFFGNYIEAIHYADEALGTFIEGLEKEGMMDNTVLAIYGDHYAIPKDKKEDLGKMLGVEMNDFNWVLHQKVPMLIHIPGSQYKGTRTIAGGGIDFMPTIMNIMGIDASNMPMLGNDLMNSAEGMAILRNGYYRTNQYLSLTADGRAFKVKDGSLYPMEKLEEQRALMEKSLRYSDEIIENDLVDEIRQYLEENGVK